MSNGSCIRRFYCHERNQYCEVMNVINTAKDEEASYSALRQVSGNIVRSTFSAWFFRNLTRSSFWSGKIRGVVQSQIGCTDFKSLKKSLDLLNILDFFGFFGFFSGFFWVYGDFINIKGFKLWNRGVVHSQIRYTYLKISKNPWIFWIFFGFFWGVYEDFFEWTTLRLTWSLIVKGRWIVNSIEKVKEEEKRRGFCH